MHTSRKSKLSCYKNYRDLYLQLYGGPDVNQDFHKAEFRYQVSKLQRVQYIDDSHYFRYNRKEDRCEYVRQWIEKVAVKKDEHHEGRSE
jgi:hypothetical protein